MPINDLYNSGYIIKRPTNVSDGAGSTTPGLTVVCTTDGRMRQLNGNEVIANDKLGQQTSHRFYCPIIDLKFLDRILNPTDNKYYEVRLVNNPWDANEFLQADCIYKEE